VIPEARPLGRRKCPAFRWDYDLDAHPERGSALAVLGPLKARRAEVSALPSRQQSERERTA
jgi:hypothetical protein